jgi:glutamyl-tRNA reductase
MKIYAVGLNHRGAHLEVREKLAIPESEYGTALQALDAAAPGAERVLLATCNRIEAYLAAPDSLKPSEVLSAFLASYRRADPADFAPAVYAFEGFEAVVHLMRVASGLDAMVVGESQILGQVKRAYQAALQAGATGRALNRLFQQTIHAAKAVQSRTSLASCDISVSGVAASLAGKIYPDLANRLILVIGAGETGQFTLEAFKNAGATKFVVANRTLERAREAAAGLGGEAIELTRLPERLAAADIIVSGIASDGHVLGYDAVGAAMETRGGRPVLIIDISVPRAVDPRVGEIENVYAYNLDDLETIAADNAVRRQRDVAVAEDLIRKEAQRFVASGSFVQVDEIVRLVREHFGRVAEEELRRLPESERAAVESLVRRLIERLLEKPISALRDGEETPLRAEILRKLFGG